MQKAQLAALTPNSYLRRMAASAAEGLANATFPWGSLGYQVETNPGP